MIKIGRGRGQPEHDVRALPKAAAPRGSGQDRGRDTVRAGAVDSGERADIGRALSTRRTGRHAALSGRGVAFHGADDSPSRDGVLAVSSEYTLIVFFFCRLTSRGIARPFRAGPGGACMAVAGRTRCDAGAAARADQVRCARWRRAVARGAERAWATPIASSSPGGRLFLADEAPAASQAPRDIASSLKGPCPAGTRQASREARARPPADVHSQVGAATTGLAGASRRP